MAELTVRQNFHIHLSPESVEIATQAAEGETLETWLSEQVNKMLEQKKVQYARSRLNLHKKTICPMIQKNVKGFESLEQAYISLGLSESVQVFGGIRKVYDEIYVKTGNPLPPSKIRVGSLEVVNAK